MDRSVNKTEGLVWVSDQLNQSDVEFSPRYLIHNTLEHKLYFHSEKPGIAPPKVGQLLEALTRSAKLKQSAPGEKTHPVKRLRDTSRHFKSLDALEDVGVELGLPGSVLELQRDPSPSVSVVHASLMWRLLFTFCLYISIPPAGSHGNREQSQECEGRCAGKSLYIALQTEGDMYRWLHSLTGDLERVRNRKFHVRPTLTITISEAKGLPSKKPLFCEVLLDATPYARTSEKLSNKGSAFWGEKLEFSEFPPIQFLTVLLLKGKTKRPHELGRIEIPAMTLYGKGAVEKWYTLKQKRDRWKTLISIRIKLHYQVLNILPFTKYEDLLSYVADDYLLIISHLVPQLPLEEKDCLAKNLVRLFYCTGEATRYLVDVVVAEVSDTSDDNLIFCGNSLATKSMDYYMQLVANHYLQSVLRRPIVRLLQETAECEVDPERIPRTTTPLQAQNNFLRHLHAIWESIYKSRSSIPPELQIVFHGIHTELGPEKQSVSNAVINACLFLRFFCAAIMSPSLFDILKEYPGEREARKLTLVAKVLQTLANHTRFEEKEAYLLLLNGWIDTEGARMAEFISYAAGFSFAEKRASVSVDLSVTWKLPQLVSLGFELSTLHHFLAGSIESLPNQDLELLLPLQILTGALTQIEEAFKESKDKILWITGTPEKCVASVGVGTYYQEAAPLGHFSLESESTGSGDEDFSSDLENGRNQIVPHTDLTWSKRDVIKYRESLSNKSSVRSSSEDETWSPSAPILPWRVSSFRETKEYADTFQTPIPERTMSPIVHLNDNSSIAEIENCLEAVQRSFNFPPDTPKPFIRRMSPKLPRNKSDSVPSLAAISSSKYRHRLDKRGVKSQKVIKLRDDLLAEIREKSDTFTELYEQACLEGEHEVQFFRILIVGPEGVGKTSLLKALKNQPFNENEDSTNLIDKTDISIADVTMDWIQNLNVKDHLIEARENCAANVAINNFQNEKKEKKETKSTNVKKGQSEQDPAGQVMTKSDIEIPKDQNRGQTIPRDQVTQNNLPGNQVNEKKYTEIKVKDTRVHEIQVTEKVGPKARVTDKTVPQSQITKKTIPENQVRENIVPENQVNEKIFTEIQITDETVFRSQVTKETIPEDQIKENIVSENQVNGKTFTEIQVTEKASPKAQFMDKTVPQSQVTKMIIPVDQGSENIMPENQVNEKTFTEIEIKGKLVNEELVERVRKNFDIDHPSDPLKFFTVWDLAGQSFLFSMHPLFLAQKAVYLIAVDLSVSLHDKVTFRKDRQFKRLDKRELQEKTYLDITLHWIRTIYSVTSSTGNKKGKWKSRIVIVFTKSDKIANPEEKAKAYFEEIKKILNQKTNCMEMVDKKFHIVSAKVRSTGSLKSLKNSIIDNGELLNTKLPINWLDFALKIFSHEKSALGGRDIEKIAIDARCEGPVQILEWFHSIGIFFFRKNVLFKSPSDLLEVIFSIIAPEYLNVKKRSMKFQSDVDRTVKKALFTKTFLNNILKINSLLHVKSEIVQLLGEFGIILHEHEEQHEYYIPYLFTKDLKAVYNSKSDHENTLILYIYFPDFQIPTSFYFAFLSLCVRRNPESVLDHGFDWVRFKWNDSITCIVDSPKEDPYIRIILLDIILTQSSSDISSLIPELEEWILDIQSTKILTGKKAKIVLDCPCASFTIEPIIPCAYYEAYLKCLPYEPLVCKKIDQETQKYNHYSWSFFNKYIKPFKNIPSQLGKDFLAQRNPKLCEKFFENDTILDNLDLIPILKDLRANGLIDYDEFAEVYQLKETEKRKFLLEKLSKGKAWAQKFYEILKHNNDYRQITNLFERYVIEWLGSDKLAENPGFTRYPFYHNPCGICLIINICNFEGVEEYRRNGSEVDVLNLEQTFESMNFLIRSYQDLKRSEFLEVLKDIRTLDHSDFDTFFCIIMSHGDETGIFPRDVATEDPITIKEIRNFFTVENCEGLHGKPKIFIVQACRGAKEHGTEKMEKSSLDCTDLVSDECINQNPKLKTETSISQIEIEQSGGDQKDMIPIDFYTPQATVEDHVAYRDRRKGSYFIKTLCSVLKKQRFNHHLVDIMVEVRRQVSEEEIKTGSQITQQCTEDDNNTLKHPFFLY